MAISKFTRRLKFSAFVASCALLVGTMGSLAEQEPILKSHLTLYVGEPLLSSGGTVMVASIPIPVEEWRALEGVNLADDDPDNRKRPSLEDGDLLFGAAVNGRANFVEMYYPEGGTFGFDFVPDPRVNNPSELKTERIAIGSGGWTHWESRTDHIWPDVSTIVVAGKTSDKGQTRVVSSRLSALMNMEPRAVQYRSATVYIPSSAQLSEATNGQVK